MVKSNHIEQKGPSTIQIVQCNVQRSSQKQSVLLQKAYAENIDILCLQEPWIDQKHQKTTKHPYYDMQSPTQTWNHKPRVLTFVRKGLAADPTLFSAEHPDVCASIIKWKTAHFHLFNIYNAGPGSVRCNESVDIITSLPNKGRSLICGDFNLHHQLWDQQASHNDHTAERLVEWLATSNSSLLSDRTVPTRANAVIDLTITSCDLRQTVYASAKVEERFDCGSDHEATLISLQSKTDFMTAPPQQLGHFNMSKLDHEKFANACAEAASHIQIPDDRTSYDGRAQALAAFTTSIQHGIIQALSASTPRSSGKQTGYRWWTPACNEAAEAHRLKRRLWKSAPTARLQEISRRERNAAQHNLTKVVKKAKAAYFRDVIDHLDSPKDVFKAVKWTQLEQHFKSPPLRDANGETVAITRQKMDLLFESHVPETGPRDLPERQFSPTCTWDTWAPLKQDEVRKAILKPTNTTPGVDSIPNEALKLSWNHMGHLITSFFNLSLGWGIYPDDMKLTRLCVIPKGGKRDRSNPKSYRLIALLPTLGKTLERAIAKRLANEAIKRGIIPPRYACAVPQRSASDLLLDLQSSLEQIVDRDHKIATLLTFDIKGAFDAICPNRLIHRLTEQGWPTVLCQWTKAFLLGRRASMKLDDQISETKHLSGALPQGSPISPILFMLFMAPLFHLHSNARGYADDGSILISGDSTESNSQKTAKQFHEIRTWCQANGLELDQAKTGLLHITRKRKAANSDITLPGGQIIKATNPKETMRWLGVEFDRKLNFSPHIRRACIKADRVINGMRLLAGCQKGATVTSLLQVVRTAVVPILTYGFQAWWKPNSKGTKTAISHADTVIRRAAKAALPLYRTTPSHLIMHAAGTPPMTLILEDLVHAEVLRMAQLHPTHILRGADNHRAKQFRNSLPGEIPGVGLCDSPVSHTRTPQTVGHISKEQAKERHQDALNYAGVRDLWIYTDGSRDSNGVCGAGWAIYRGQDLLFEGKTSCGQQSEVFDAEATAALQGTIAATKEYGRRGETVSAWLCIDNQAIVTNLTKPAGPFDKAVSSQNELNLTRQLLEGWPKESTHVLWVPGHLGIIGNERADARAKEGSRQHFEGDPQIMSLAHARRWRRDWLRRQLEDWWKNTRRGDRHTESKMEAPAPWKKHTYKGVSRPNVAHVLAARSGHGDLADYHDRLHHEDARTDCPRCGSRTDRVHLWCCRKARSTQRPLSARFVNKLLLTERGIIYLGRWLQRADKGAYCPISNRG